jgi:CBS domain-containing protein
MRYLSNPLSSLALPSLYLYSAVVAVTSVSSVLDAMTLMSDEGVSTVAVIDEDQHLLSAISVTDIGKVTFSNGFTNYISRRFRLLFRLRIVIYCQHQSTSL